MAIKYKLVMSRKNAQQWIKEARNDFEMAEILLESKKYNGTVFHSQQAAEKAIKSLLYLYDIQPWGHSILKLWKNMRKKVKNL